ESPPDTTRPTRASPPWSISSAPHSPSDECQQALVRRPKIIAPRLMRRPVALAAVAVEHQSHQPDCERSRKDHAERKRDQAVHRQAERGKAVRRPDDEEGGRDRSDAAEDEDEYPSRHETSPPPSSPVGRASGAAARQH